MRMSWEKTLQNASFRTVIFDVITVEDEASHALSEHKYPYVDGADIEDQGLEPRRFHVTAVFWGGDYETRLQAFIKVLDARGAAELIHPVYGSIKLAQVVNRKIKHDAENPDRADLDIEFVEHQPGNPFFDRTLPVQKVEAIGVKTATARLSVLSGFQAAIAKVAAIRSNVASMVGRIANIEALAGGIVNQLRSQVLGIVTSGLGVLDYPTAFMADVRALVSGISGIPTMFVGNDPTNDSAPMLVAQQAIASLQVPLVPTGAQSEALPVLPDTIQEAIAPGVVAADAADALLILTPVNTERVLMQADVVQAVFARESETPQLTPVEIERLVNNVRGQIEGLIADIRLQFPYSHGYQMIEALRDVALATQEAARTVLETRPPLISRDITSHASARLFAHWWYGDHTRVDELYRLNNLPNPNFLQPGDRLNAYAR